MPQMMPMSWMILFSTFSMTLILFATMNFYTSIQQTKISSKEKVSKKIMNWKW